ncbi:hypothetical protein D7V88_39005 [Corallococcus terminator]|uniref:Uncharacterized protein n=1 Tax=Corallococcus terminator TaxID=2316733 RepID=A0A3A8HMZ9_9BACT|nr:hypothetical protein D7V88_39005 [Corallococcus terminator]
MASALLLLCACDGDIEVPGTLPNPKLAQMMNRELDRELLRFGTENATALQMKGPQPYIAEAGENGRRWLQEISSVVSRCRHGMRNESKSNLMEYDITLKSGVQLKGVYTGTNCAYWSKLRPLVLRANFEDGRVTEVFTDGRERQSPVDFYKTDTMNFAKYVLRADQSRNPANYRPAPASKADIAKQWDTP